MYYATSSNKDAMQHVQGKGCNRQTSGSSLYATSKWFVDKAKDYSNKEPVEEDHQKAVGSSPTRHMYKGAVSIIWQNDHEILEGKKTLSKRSLCSLS